ncbi:MAG: L-arabinose isomerase [Verrucomicrobia bacterium]|nr:L-arabinose isomerase [Verrucomicrobiota bacterium]MCH8525709.1 L-arabinose isomerase [Kiritimatiellia bacterium]
MKNPFESLEIWFVTGSQHLYGPGPLQEVSAHAQEIAAALDANEDQPVRIVCKPVVTRPEEIRAVCGDADQDPACAGLIFWMHTFSPAKMWISGLNHLKKPFCHLHTQYGAALPWSSIDMDYMNLHQSAHGDREFGFICTRLGIERDVIVGHWQDQTTRGRLAAWSRVAAAWHHLRQTKIVRFGDNMRQVAVTEGDKVEAESVFGFSVNTHGIGDLAERIDAVTPQEVAALCEEYNQSYTLAPALQKGGASEVSLQTAARIEAGLRAFLEEGGFTAFTDTFEDLHGLEQLPGLPVQRLMAEGYGFGAEGDWKHAALVRMIKLMASGHDRGTSFMEDYTYHMSPERPLVLGAHMLEICPSIADAKPSCEIHPLGIGGKADPVRLVFDGKPGPALNASLVDMGNRFRLLVHEVTAHAPAEPLPKLPVARVVWESKPDFETGLSAWILAGGAHHTCFTYSVNTAQLESFARMAGIECLVIDAKTDLRAFRNELRWNHTAYGLQGLGR